MTKSMGRSSREPEFYSQHPQSSSQLAVIPVLENLPLVSVGTAQMGSINIHEGKSPYA